MRRKIGVRNQDAVVLVVLIYVMIACLYYGGVLG
jgi:hypothetical protein